MNIQVLQQFYPLITNQRFVYTDEDEYESEKINKMFLGNFSSVLHIDKKKFTFLG